MFSSLRLAFVALALLALGCGAPARLDDDSSSCTKPCGSACCTAAESCDATSNKCVSCEPKTCAALGASCGTIDDGCGGVVTCQPCGEGDTCGADHRCVHATCVPKTCTELGAECGSIDDGCGNTLSCPACPPGEHCGGGGPNRCGTQACTPETDRAFCQRLGKNCGQVVDFDNCDNSRSVASCGNCTAPESCGGGGSANVCGCTGESDVALCTRAGATCGTISVVDACGRTRRPDCGGCSQPQTCGGGGTPNACGCVSETDAAFCSRLGATCGRVTRTDNCGVSRTATCGQCGSSSFCDSSSHTCRAGCSGNADCDATSWCNFSSGHVCEACPADPNEPDSSAAERVFVHQQFDGETVTWDGSLCTSRDGDYMRITNQVQTGRYSLSSVTVDVTAAAPGSTTTVDATEIWSGVHTTQTISGTGSVKVFSYVNGSCTSGCGQIVEVALTTTSYMPVTYTVTSVIR